MHTNYNLYSHFRMKLGTLKKMPKVQGLIRYTGSVVFWILLIKTTNIKILLLLEQAELPGTSVNILPVENLGHEF